MALPNTLVRLKFSLAELIKKINPSDETFLKYVPSQFLQTDENIEVKFSDRDSDGNVLTEEQIKYFNDSKVRSEDGRLKVVFHGSPSTDINSFEDGSTIATVRI